MTGPEDMFFNDAAPFVDPRPAEVQRYSLARCARFLPSGIVHYTEISANAAAELLGEGQLIGNIGGELVISRAVRDDYFEIPPGSVAPPTRGQLIAEFISNCPPQGIE